MTLQHDALIKPTDRQRKQYQDEGYFILENVIPPGQLAALQAECMRFVEEKKRRHDAGEFNLNVANGKFFIEEAASKSDVFREFAFGEQMAEVARATVGDNAYLFYDQLVVKGPDKGQSFAWHQDSGYVNFPHRPYVTCWVALDDVTEENGTAYVLPYSRAGTREMVPHRRDEKTTEMVGYFGPDPGEPVIAPAGSMAVFSSTCFHRSGFNSTSRYRRVYVIQYSPEIIRKPDTGVLAGQAVPFLREGKRVPSSR
jgi:ectoine hydroxylase-related dioxygenase (phytanoyl-CoA dioxygenase family)